LMMSTVSQNTASVTGGGIKNESGFAFLTNVTISGNQASGGGGLDTLVAPGDSNPPIVFEPPEPLSGGDLEVWVIASGGALWGGCQLWVSSDGNTYAMAGTIYRGGRQGVLTAALASHADPDTANTLSVDLGQSEGQLLSGTKADADDLAHASHDSATDGVGHRDRRVAP